MKELADGTQVSSRSFYYLLDYNDRNDRRPMIDLWGVERLKDLNIQQYTYLFKHVTNQELKNLESK